MCTQGYCQGAPAEELTAGDVPMADLHENQCLLTTDSNAFTWHAQSAASNVWLDNLYIRAVGNKPDQMNSAITWDPGTDTAHLWLTHMTLQGGSEGLAAYAPALVDGTLRSCMLDKQLKKMLCSIMDHNFACRLCASMNFGMGRNLA